MGTVQAMTRSAATNDGAKQRIAAFMTGFTAEITPGSAAKTPDYREHMRPGTVVYITFLPGSDFDDTIAAATRLEGEGFLPVPHFAARSIPDAAFLEDKLARLAGEVGLERVLVIGGAVDQPAGDFSDTMQLLETGLFDKHGIRKFGVAGHPEGSPDISDEAIAEALRWKNDFAERSGAERVEVGDLGGCELRLHQERAERPAGQATVIASIRGGVAGMTNRDGIDICVENDAAGVLRDRYPIYIKPPARGALHHPN